MQKTVVFFSSTFPSELSIGKELQMLNDNFSRVIYIPLEFSQTPVKQNAALKNVEYKFFNRQKIISWQDFSFNEIRMALTILLSYSPSLKERFQLILNFRKYLYILKRNLFYARNIEELIKAENLRDAIFYDYWFENATLALAILKKKKMIKHFFSRAHGFDVYDFRWGKNMHVPFRGFKIKYIDSVYCISSDGKKYFREHVPYKYHNKIKLSYVGVDTAINNSNNLTPSGRYVLVSASHTADFKRVHLIPDLIKDVSIPMEWIHFGAGVNDNLIKQKIINLPSNITVTLKGNVDNTELMKFYNSNYVNAFISLSKTEGLPISMMECAMFGAPIFACDVGGIKDIVSPDKGMLIDANLEVEDMREKFLQFMKIDYNRSFIMDAAHQKFDYRKNYSELYNEFKR